MCSCVQGNDEQRKRLLDSHEVLRTTSARVDNTTRMADENGAGC